MKRSPRTFPPLAAAVAAALFARPFPSAAAATDGFCWAEGADRYISDCIALFEEFGWDWTYHAFREWAGWSVEHEGTCHSDLHPSDGNPRKRALLDGFKNNR